MKRRAFLKQTLGGATAVTVGAAFHREIAALEPEKILALGGTSATSVSYYNRMFPWLRRKPTRPGGDIEEGLTKLGKDMWDRDPPLSDESEPELLEAGYTYLGQFIDHDLTRDLTPLRTATDNVEQTRNFRTPFLDLDHLYGGGPNLSPFLYQRGNHGAERFLIGNTIASSGLGASERDLPRNLQGIALVGDARQDENLIIAQLHVAFLTLHNLVVSSKEALNASPHYRRKGDSDFATAQRVLRWHYQWLVRNDFLKKVLDPLVYNELPKIEEVKRAEAANNEKSNFAIPVEFSAAAFRFGHSMVRDLYKTGINNRQKEPLKLEELLQRTGLHGNVNSALPADWVVCWNRFFEIGSETSQLNRARKIDTQIANELHRLKETATKAFSVILKDEHPEPHLPVRTLLRGFRLDLPSGQDVGCAIACREPHLRLLTQEEITLGPHEAILKDGKYGFFENTPLWYYVLKEAEILGGQGKQLGQHLGPVGSRIVADVIIGALAADRDSYFWSPDHANWRPTLNDGRINSIGKLLEFIYPPKSVSALCEPLLTG